MIGAGFPHCADCHMSPTWGFSVPGFCVFDGLHEQVEGGGVLDRIPWVVRGTRRDLPDSHVPPISGRPRAAAPWCWADLSLASAWARCIG
jgi:hypothetical protein